MNELAGSTQAWADDAARRIAELSGVLFDDELARQLRSEAAYLASADREDFGQAILLEALECVASGTSLDRVGLTRLIHHVRQRIYRAVEREQALPGDVADASSRDGGETSLMLDLVNAVSPADWQVLALMCDGFDVDEIASKLGVSKGTIYRRQQSIRRAIDGSRFAS